MSRLALIVALLGIFATLEAALIAKGAVDHVYAAGPTPPKQLEVLDAGAYEPFSSSGDWKDILSVTIKSGNVDLKTFYEDSIHITNTGKSPILPSDYQVPLSIKVAPEWRIIGVSPGPSNPTEEKWSQNTDQIYVGKPILLNPGDSIVANVFIAKSDGKATADIPHVTVEGRIINMRSFAKGEDLMDKIVKDRWIIVEHYGYAVLFLVAIFVANQLIYLLAFRQLRLLNSGNVRPIVSMVFVPILSLLSSDAITSYAFPNAFGGPINDWLTAPWIMLNIVAMGTFIMLILGDRKRRSTEKKS